MIATLNGVVSEKLADVIVLEVNGVGYGLFVTSEDFVQLATGRSAKFYVYEHIREDSHDLFGFVKQATKELFEKLLSVKNVGPKVALAVLGIGTDGRVRTAIAAGDVKFLQTAKGVGKRAAEQIVVELRDKVGLVSGSEAENIVYRGSLDPNDETVQALVALGYNESDAQRAADMTDKSLPTEERIKLALKGRF